MKCYIQGIAVHYEEYGEGKPILFIHGWGPDNRMMSGCFEPIFKDKHGYRRIYVDLPSFGQTPAPAWITTHDHMVDILCDFVDTVIGDSNFLLAGCSYGGYLSLGLIHKMGKRIDGAFFLVPAVDVRDPNEVLPEREIIWKSEHMDLIEKCQALDYYMNMAVVASPEGYERWLTDIQPGLNAKTDALGAYTEIHFSPEMQDAIRKLTYHKPTCILTGRQDSTSVGYARAYHLTERFPRATYAVLDCGGHILQIDNEPLFQALVKDWIWRVELSN